MTSFVESVINEKKKKKKNTDVSALSLVCRLKMKVVTVLESWERIGICPLISFQIIQANRRKKERKKESMRIGKQKENKSEGKRNWKRKNTK